VAEHTNLRRPLLPRVHGGAAASLARSGLLARLGSDGVRDHVADAVRDADPEINPLG